MNLFFLLDFLNDKWREEKKSKKSSSQEYKIDENFIFRERNFSLNKERVLDKNRDKELRCGIYREFTGSSKWDKIKSGGKKFWFSVDCIVMVYWDFLEYWILISNIGDRNITLLILYKIDS